jgi:hypothetical protein
MRALQKHLNTETKVLRSEQMAEHLSKLTIGQEDLKEMGDLQFKVEERLI